MKSDLHAETVRELLQYDPDTGAFVRKRSKRPDFVGALAGSLKMCRGGKKYWVIYVGGKTYQAHRLAWLYVYGEWPALEIDHINGDRLDNRIANLRLATDAQNARNACISQRNTSGYKGVSFERSLASKPWRARIRVNWKSINLGCYASPQEAHAAYMAAAVHYFGAFARFE